MLGTRWDVKVNGELDFADEELPRRLHGIAKPYTPAGIDYFAFRRGLYDEIPDFALGRGPGTTGSPCRPSPEVRRWSWMRVRRFFAFHQIHGNYPYIPRELSGVGEE